MDLFFHFSYSLTLHMSHFAWAAGLYEGEGCLSCRHTATVELKIKMTDLDVLQRFQSIFNIGSITQSASPSLQPHWKPIWTFRVSNQAGVRKILSAITPYLGIRRGYKAQNVLDAIDGIT